VSREVLRGRAEELRVVLGAMRRAARAGAGSMIVVPADLAAVMAATQRPVAAATLGEKCTSAGWKTKPTSYLISAQDHAINPETERFMANRMGGTVETIQASRVAFISRPVEVAAFIMAALP